MIYENIIATVQAIAAAIAVWQTERDYGRTLETYDVVFSNTLAAADIRVRAEGLQQVMPQYVAEVFYVNIADCWKQFTRGVKGRTRHDEFVPHEETNRECVCSNLQTLVRNSGALPADLLSTWMTFQCGPKPPVSSPNTFLAPGLGVPETVS